MRSLIQMPHVKVNPLWQHDQHPNCFMLYDKREAMIHISGWWQIEQLHELVMGSTPSLTLKFLRPVSYLHRLGPSLSWSCPLESKRFASRRLPTLWPPCRIMLHKADPPLPTNHEENLRSLYPSCSIRQILNDSTLQVLCWGDYLHGSTPFAC